MKKKFIWIVAAVLLVVAVIALLVPAMFPAGDTGAPDEGMAIGTADLIALDSGVVFAIDKDPPLPAPAGAAVEISLWLALGAVTITAVAYRRVLPKSYDLMISKLRGFSDISADTAGRIGGGPRDCILPAAA